jgi:hypothetical protein
MAIYYTAHEGGQIYQLPIKSNHIKLIRQLNRNRAKANGRYFTYVKVKINNGKHLRLLIHSVIFIKGLSITKIWDSNICGYRKHIYGYTKLRRIKIDQKDKKSFISHRN